MTPRYHRVFAALSVILVLGACSQSEPAQDAGMDAEATTTQAAPTLETATSLGVPNARQPKAGLITAGQISQQQMDALAAAGYEHFISLRLPDESGAGWEESYAAERSWDFQRVPVAGSSGLTRENVEALDRILDQAGDEPTVLYCGSSNRVGALMALRAHWLEGASAEEALELGRAAGMTRLEPAVREMLGS